MSDKHLGAPCTSRALATGLALALIACSRSGNVAPAAPAPAPPPPPSAASPLAEEVCVGLHHSCARSSDGRVACWGDNENRQVAPTDELQIERPRLVTEFPAAVQLRCGKSETCVRTQAGTVHCLGGVAGVARLPLPGPAKDLFLTGGGCALGQDARLTCWEHWPREFFEAATGVRELATSPPLSDAVCANGAEAPFCLQPLHLGAVQRHDVTALTGAEQLVNASYDGARLCGMFGKAMRCTDGFAPAGLETIVAPYAGGLCYRDGSHALHCEGEPNELTAAVPAKASQLAIGFDHGCAIVDGTVQCWGAAESGQLGQAAPYLHVEPRQVPGISDATSIAGGRTQVCAWGRAGSLVCWGASARHVTGFADYAPMDLTPPEPVLEVRTADVGRADTPSEHGWQPLCIRGKSGWWCHESAWERAKLDEHSPLSRWNVRTRQLAPDRQCAVTSDEKLVCAGGADRSGEDKTVKTKLVSFAPDERFTRTTSLFSVQGSDQVCALTAARTVRCFDAETAAPVVSPSIAALASVAQVAAEGSGADGLACALTDGGAVWCWGSGRSGQLGVARPADPSTAVNISGLPPAKQIVVGGRFACALGSDGHVYCWGSNRAGNAPDGSTGVVTAPIAVPFPN